MQYPGQSLSRTFTSLGPQRAKCTGLHVAVHFDAISSTMLFINRFQKEFGEGHGRMEDHEATVLLDNQAHNRVRLHGLLGSHQNVATSSLEHSPCVPDAPE